jgi:hypothetical protein
MSAALFGKKDSDDVDSSQASPHENPSELEQLTSQLDALGDLFAQANRRIAAYLIRRDSQDAGGKASQETSEPASEHLAAIAKKLDELTSGAAPTPSAAPGGPDEQTLKGVLEPLAEKLEHVEKGVKTLCECAAPADGPTNTAVLDAVAQLQTRLDGGIQRLADLLTPPEETDDEATAAGAAHWEWAILGPDLAQRPELAFQRQQLLSGLLEGDPGACTLAGQLLVFQSAPAERLPQLLKDLGEAFYRWQPKTAPGTNPMEEALLQWLKRSCEEAGINNTIVLVHPGERFDATRHTAASRGVEIREVHGWIVLRDNGKVYTKASVAVQ